jgi:aminoglycoside phosphotransferase (APT) family kinase protein
MRHEPTSINRARLIDTVRDLYGLSFDELVFVPVGVPSVCYVLRERGEARYFLKLWPETRAARSNTARRDTSLALTRALHERGIYGRVPYPLATRTGALWATFSGIPFAIFPFLAGHSKPASWPISAQAVSDAVARILATIHRATPALADVLPARETFDIPFEADLLRGLEVLEHVGACRRSGVRALRDVVLPRCTEILDQLARLHRLQGAVRRLAGPVVLCHTDMGGDNLLVDDQGQISIIDWDDATVAPPEHDLQCALGPSFGRFLEVYGEAGGAHPLHLDHFAFFLLRRYLNDMAVRLLRILEENTTAEQDQDALAGIEASGFVQWSALDKTLAGIAAGLRHRTQL